MARLWRFDETIDTDVLAPGKYMKAPLAELATHCLEAVRPEFAAGARAGDVMLGAPNMGVGSSREQAAEVLKHLGIARVIGRFNAIKAQRLGGRSARLVQCGHKSLPCFHLCALCVCRGHDDPGPY